MSMHAEQREMMPQERPETTEKWRRAILLSIGAIASALAEYPEGEQVPASPIYLALGMNEYQYRIVIDLMADRGDVIDRGATIELTAQGRELARKVDEAIGKRT